MFLITLSLSLKAHARGFKKIWQGDINDLGWFDELQNNPQTYLPLSQQPGQSYVYPNVTTFGNSQPVYQLPGHSVVITTGPNGQQSKSILDLFFIFTRLSLMYATFVVCPQLHRSLLPKHRVSPLNLCPNHRVVRAA
jgi:hypothetical protein